MPTNDQVAKAILTDTFENEGLLPPESAKKFLDETYERTALRSVIRHEMHDSTSGEIDRIGINSRILRESHENFDDGERAGVYTSSLHYQTVDARLTYEISKKSLRQNIEREELEKHVTSLMVGQCARDLEDLSINGDEATPASHPDYKFLKINDGFKKQILNGGNVYDVSNIKNGEMSIDTFYLGAMCIDSKYLEPTMRWIMSPRRKMEWDRVLNAQGISVGGFAAERFYSSPASYPVIEVPRLDDNTILFTDPLNLIEIATYHMTLEHDKTSRDAIYKQMIYYAMHLDVDFIIEELRATLAITGLKSLRPVNGV